MFRCLTLATLMLVPALLSAQGTVTGQLTLEERRGADHGDVRTAVVWLEPRGGVIVRRTEGRVATDGVIDMRGREFIPHVRIVRTGGVVEFPNKDPFRHNVFSNVEPGAFDLGLYPRGASRGVVFARPGVYPIYCNIHSKMVSFVVAVPSDWWAQPAADGRFLLRDVPPGTYTLHAWHERADVATRVVTVSAAAPSDVHVTLDARAYVPGPHLNKFGRPYSVIRADKY